MKLEKDQQFRTEMSAKEQIETSMMGKTMKIDQKFLTVFQMDVEDTNTSDNYILRNTYNRVRFEQSMSGLEYLGNTVIDIKNPEENKDITAPILAPSMQTNDWKIIYQRSEQKRDILSMDLRVLTDGINAQVGQQENNVSNYALVFPDKPVKCEIAGKKKKR